MTTLVDRDRYVDVAEGARLVNRCQETLRNKLRLGRIEGERVGHSWFINRAALLAFFDSGPDGD